METHIEYDKSEATHNQQGGYHPVQTESTPVLITLAQFGNTEF